MRSAQALVQNVGLAGFAAGFLARLRRWPDAYSGQAVVQMVKGRPIDGRLVLPEDGGIFRSLRGTRRRREAGEVRGVIISGEMQETSCRRRQWPGAPAPGRSSIGSAP